MFKALGLCGVLVFACMPALTYAQTDWNRIYQHNQAIQNRIDRQHEEQRRNDEANRRINEAQQPQQNSSPTSPNPRPRVPPPPASYVAVVWHPDATDVWAVWNHPSGSVAAFDAGGACHRIMGSGCKTAQEVANASVVVVRSEDGNLHTAGGRTPDAARNSMLGACAKGGIKCEVMHVFTAVMPQTGKPVPEAYFPDSSVIRNDRRRFAALAWTTGIEKPWAGVAWVSGGHISASHAEKSALEKCRSESGRPCSVALSGAREGGYIMIYRDAKGATHTSHAPSKAEVEQLAEEKCKQVGLSCRTAAIIDARELGLRTVNAAQVMP